VVGVQRPIWGFKGLIDLTLAQDIILTTFKDSTSSIISVSSSKSALSSKSASVIQSASTIPSTDRGKKNYPECSQASAQGAPCTFIPSFLCGIFSHTLFLRPETLNYTNCDHDKFSLLDSPYALYPIPARSTAL
jgi:hypothetical protein